MSTRLFLKAAVGAAAAIWFGHTLAEVMDEEHEYRAGPVTDPARPPPVSRKDREDFSNWFPENYFINKDKLAIFYRKWLPAPIAQPSVKAVVVISHGLGEYSMRYERVAQALVAKGFAVYALDHQGHGQSEGTRTYVKNFLDFVHDVHQMTEIAKRKHPEARKIFLLGHSMGALIAIHSVHEAPKLYDGTVLSAPPLHADIPPGLATLGPILSEYLPKLPGPALDISTLSHDPSVVDRYVSDPLNNQGSLKFRLLNELIEAIAKVKTFQANFSIPYLLVHGTGDKMCPYNASKAFHEATTVQDKTFVTYDDAFHELFNEPGHGKKSIKEAVEWFDKRI